MWTDSTLKPIEDNDSYVSPDGTYYPPSFPKSEIAWLRPVRTTPMPDVSLRKVNGFVIGDDLVQVWQVSDYSQAELAERFESARAAIKTAADQKARELRDQVTAGISAAEMASWPIKRAEAMAYQAKGAQATDADAPMLAREAQARGCDMAALAAKVAAKSEAISMLEASIAGRCGAIQDAAKTAATVADLAAIDIEAGWPA